MKVKLLFLSLSFLLLVNTLSLQVQARSMIYDILNKGSEWSLNVDGEEGTLELLGGSGSSTGGSGWRMSMDVRWQGNNGTLRAEADNENTQQRVFLNLQRKNGIAVSCEGYIAQESECFMAGITKYPTNTKTMNGAWYAVKTRIPPPVILPNKKFTQRKIEHSDSEPPKVNINIEGILVFTITDTIKLRASAEDNVKVMQISVFIDGQEKKICQAWECRYSEIVTKPGPHKCWATAIDSAGNKGQSPILEFMVHPTAKPGPNLNTRLQPSMPNSRNTITFTADASHPSEVESITIYVNGLPVQTCNQSHCEYIGGPYPGPQITWRVSAKSIDGNVTYGNEASIPIVQVKTGSCSISGKVYGPGAKVVNGFFIVLYGPNNLLLYRGIESFNRDGIYTFPDLPAGKYKLSINTKADTPIGSYPDYRVVECTTGPVNNVDFELK